MGKSRAKKREELSVPDTVGGSRSAVRNSCAACVYAGGLNIDQIWAVELEIISNLKLETSPRGSSAFNASQPHDNSP
ncbi:hypothetical protein ACLOJK_019945 [Asimina triloba]